MATVNRYFTSQVIRFRKLSPPREETQPPRGEPLWPTEISGKVSVEKLKRNLRRKRFVGERPAEPELLTVQGTFYPCVLLSSGWWERHDGARGKDSVVWRDSLQEWLFKGFDLWAPSWDVSLATELETGDVTHLIGQLGYGDEADSIPVLCARSKASMVREQLLSGGCPVLQVDVTGLLVHTSKLSPEQFKELSTLRPNQSLEDPSVTGSSETDESGYCLVVTDSDEESSRLQEFSLRLVKPELYSGYLWQCWGPRKKRMGGLNLEDVYFVWEHTNFSNGDAIKYNLDALEHKVRRVQERIDDPVLLQKSHGLLVPGTAELSTKQFYDLLFERKGQPANAESSPQTQMGQP